MSAGDLTREEASLRDDLLHIIGYQITLDVTDAVSFAAVSTIRFHRKGSERSTFVDLVDAQLEQAVLNGVQLDATLVYDGTRLVLHDLADENELRVVSRGEYSTIGVGLHRTVDPEDGRVYLFTHFEVAHARRVFACFDQPGLGAPFTLTVTAPAHWTAMSASPTPDPAANPEGTATWRFEPTPVLAPYQFSLVTGEYAIVADDGAPVPLRLACRHGMRPYLEADELFDVTRQGLAHFAELFDHPYPYAKLDQIFAPGYGMVGMENAGCVTLSEDFLFRGRVPESMRDRRADVLLHEIAHMWFGNLVRIAWWSDLWLKEAMATYLSTRCLAVQRPQAWTTFAVATGWARAQDEQSTAHAVAVEIPSLAAIDLNFDAITYGKGAAVLRQLVATIGEEAFVEGLRLFVRRHAFGAVTLLDLVAALGEAAGRELGEWCHRWLRLSGIDVLRAEIVVAQGLVASCEVAQEAPAVNDAPRQHRLAVGFYRRGPEGIERVAGHEVELVGERVGVPGAKGMDCPDLVLVNDGELSYARTKLDAVSAATVRLGIAEIRDELARAQCWGAAWDMVRDAQLPARDFLTMVESGIGVEDQAGVVQTLLWRASLALDEYADPAFREPGRARLAAVAADALRTAAPGGDLQLCWAWCLAMQATTPGQLALTESWLAGLEQIPGLAVDTELRWAILRRLVITGTVGAERVEEELLRDPTATGQRRAAGVRAAAPTLAAKQAAWRMAIDSTSLEPELLGSVLYGFLQPDQPDVLAHFAEPYFEQLERIWAGRIPELAQALVIWLYPSTQVGDAIVARTDRYLAEADPPPELRRLLDERRSDMRRAMRARDLDRLAGSGVAS